MTDFRPTSLGELQEAVLTAVAEGQAMEICGGGSKRALGRPLQVEHRLSLDGLTGVVDFEPAELVLTAKAGTPLHEIETLLAASGQMLAFEPTDWRGLLGSAGKVATLGGAIACNLAGPRRVRAGAARDHFLGFTGVNGFGEAFKAGGKVVKNVTGYDLCKLMAGSYGTLAVLADITVKVVPRPEESASLLILGLDDEQAIGALSDGLNAPHEVSAAAHLPAMVACRSGVAGVASSGAPVTVLRVEGPPSSVAFRKQALRGLFGTRGSLMELDQPESERLWREIAAVSSLLPETNRVIWRLSLPPASGAAVMTAIATANDIIGYYDWGGGLIWLAATDQGDGGAAAIRAALAPHGGHATLMRAPDALRAEVPVFEPLPDALAALTRRIKDSFDPNHLFNPGRLYPGM